MKPLEKIIRFSVSLGLSALNSSVRVPVLLTFLGLFLTGQLHAQYTVIQDFEPAGDTLAHPSAELVTDGNFHYGTVLGGGASGYGYLFRTNMDGSGLTVLLDFDAGNIGTTNTSVSLIVIGTAIYGIADKTGGDGMIFIVKTDGTGFSLLHDFGGSDGSNPAGGLTLVNTDLIGTTRSGGDSDEGVVFRYSLSGDGFQKIFDFDSINGANPNGGLLFSGGSLYGLAGNGGADGAGVLYRINPDGSGFEIIHDFDDASGSHPMGSLSLIDSSFYGTCSSGGTNSMGTVFRIGDTGEDFESLVSFDGPGGNSPRAGMTQVENRLYGTTYLGGANNLGVIFSLYKDRPGFEVLYDFVDTSGYHPISSVVVSGSKLIGTATDGGAINGGVLFDVETGYPGVQSPFMGYNNIQTSQIILQWGMGDGDSVIVFMKRDTTGAPYPKDGVSYTADPVFGQGSQIDSSGWFCVFNGYTGRDTITGLEPNTTYRAMALSYNGGTGEEKYLLSTTDNNPANLTTYNGVPGFISSFGINAVYSTSLYYNHQILDDGGIPMNAHGVCWASHPLPTLEDNVNIDGKNIGLFRKQIGNLIPNTTYYLRPFILYPGDTLYPYGDMTAEVTTPGTASSANGARDMLILPLYNYSFGAGPNNWVFGSIAGGDANKGTDPGDQPDINDLQVYLDNPFNTYTDAKWRAMYKAIALCNDAILGVGDSLALDPFARKPLLAELYFLRGFYYFELIKVFGPYLPWIDETNMGQETPLPNDTNVWAQVENDFINAINDLPEVTYWGGPVNSWAAKAFYGKLLLYQKRYAEAKAVFDDVIANGKTSGGDNYALLTNFDENFNILFNNSSESVFAQQCEVDDDMNWRANPGYMLAYPYGGGPGGCCGFFQPSQSLVNSFKVDSAGLPLFDPAHATFPFNETDLLNDDGLFSGDPFSPDTLTPVDPRLDWTVGRRGIPYLDWGINPGADWIRNPEYGGPYSPIKNVYRQEDQMAGRAGMVGGWAPGSELNYDMMRFADVLLMAAECEVELGNLAAALTYVNQVRSRAGNSHVQDGGSDAANYQIGLYPSFPDQQYAREAVRFERKLELAMEGHRFFDLARWGADYAEQELNAGYLAYESAHRTQFAGAVFDTCDRYFTIPQAVTLFLPVTKSLGDSAFRVTTASPSGLPVSFSSSDTNVVKIIGDSLYIIGLGEATVTVYQAVKPGCLPASTDSAVITITEMVIPDLAASYTKTDVSEPGGHDGQIYLTVTGGTPPYTYEWNNGAFTKNINYLYEGTYTVTISDAGDRTLVVSVEIKGPEVQICDISVDFSYEVDSLTQEVSFEVSTLEYEYFWTFGDGTATDVPSPSHVYTYPGQYEVCLSAYDDSADCSVEVCKMIAVGTPECNAAYSYVVDGTDSLLVHFSDQSLGAISSWYWNFADGTVSAQQDVDHKFAEAGSYEVCLYTLDSISGCQSEVCELITIGAVPMVADFAYFINPDSRKVTFTNISTGTITHYYWTYGDGTVSTAEDSSHVYAEPGTYTVCLSVRNSATGKFTEICKVLKVGTQPCNLEASYSYFIDPVSRKVSFTDKSLGTIHSWFWNFGDGRSSTRANPVHQFNKAGYYLVSLSVRDTITNCTDFHAELIQIGDIDCKAHFKYSIDPASMTVTFEDKSQGRISDYFWTFDDGNVSTEKDPVHQYENPGLYQVSLTVLDSSGTCMDYQTIPVQVGYIDCSADFTVFIDSLTNTAYFTSQVLGTSIRYYWVFSDGKISTEKNPVHRFQYPGYQKVSLNTFNVLSGCMDHQEKVILIGSQGIDCEADFIYRTDETTRTVSFADKSLGEGLSYYWNFGDGYSSPASNPLHQYSEGGIYNVCLTVYSTSGIQNTTCKQVYAGTRETGNCVARFIYTVDDDALLVNYSDKSQGKPDKWYWEFGDKGTSKLQNPAKVYDQPGYYIVRQQIAIQSTGCISDAFALVNVDMEGGLVAGYGYTIDSSQVKAESYPVDYVGVSLGDANKYKWSFGDGTYDSTTTTPTHVYSAPGTYEVCLIVYDEISGDSDTSCNWVVVESPLSVGYQFGENAISLNCYPNPSDDYCTVTFNLTSSGYTEVTLYSITGNKLRYLVSGSLDRGRHTYVLDSSQWENGMYLVSLQTDSGTVVQRITIQH